MGVQTLRPNATVQQGAYTTIVGGGTAHGNLGDGTEAGTADGTAIDITASGYDATRGLILDFATPTIPAGARITGVRVRFRARDNSGYPFDSLLRARPRVINTAGTAYAEGTGASSNWGATSLTTYNGAYETLTPHGLEWTTTDLANLQVLVTAQTQFFGSGGRVSEVWLDVQYNEQPTTTVTAPTEGSVQGTNYPTLGWTYSDPDGDALNAVQVKVFTSAQYSAGGFDPSTAAAYYDSGWIGSGNPGGMASPYPLPNDTYRVYVRSRHTFGNGYFESAWDYNQFSVNVTPPPTPTCSAVALTDGTVQVTATRGGTTPVTEGYDFEYQDTGSTEWLPLRLSPAAGTGTTVSVVDYEAPPNATRFYRTRAYRISSGFRIVSAWSGSFAGATPTATRWRLLDPVAASAGILVRLAGDTLGHDSEEPTQVLYPLGRRNPVVISGTIQGETYNLTFVFSDATTYQQFEALRNTQRVLLLKSPRGIQTYIKFVGSRAVTEDRTTADIAPYWYTVTVQAVEQDRP